MKYQVEMAFRVVKYLMAILPNTGLIEMNPYDIKTKTLAIEDCLFLAKTRD